MKKLEQMRREQLDEAMDAIAKLCGFTKEEVLDKLVELRDEKAAKQAQETKKAPVAKATKANSEYDVEIALKALNHYLGRTKGCHNGGNNTAKMQAEANKKAQDILNHGFKLRYIRQADGFVVRAELVVG